VNFSPDKRKIQLHNEKMLLDLTEELLTKFGYVVEGTVAQQQQQRSTTAKAKTQAQKTKLNAEEEEEENEDEENDVKRPKITATTATTTTTKSTATTTTATGASKPTTTGSLKIAPQQLTPMQKQQQQQRHTQKPSVGVGTVDDDDEDMALAIVKDRRRESQQYEQVQSNEPRKRRAEEHPQQQTDNATKRQRKSAADENDSTFDFSAKSTSDISKGRPPPKSKTPAHGSNNDSRLVAHVDIEQLRQRIAANRAAKSATILSTPTATAATTVPLPDPFISVPRALLRSMTVIGSIDSVHSPTLSAAVTSANAGPLKSATPNPSLFLVKALTAPNETLLLFDAQRAQEMLRFQTFRHSYALPIESLSNPLLITTDFAGGEEQYQMALDAARTVISDQQNNNGVITAKHVLLLNGFDVELAPQSNAVMMVGISREIARYGMIDGSDDGEMGL
jgi:DNA mismatch repair ATPase MutL